MMLLAVRKDVGGVPGGGFHYMLHPIKMDSKGQAAVFELMGYVIIEVPDTVGDRLLDQAIKALNHQIEVATLTDRFERERGE